ncbi:MAG: fatty acid desaturase, partial [Litoreibacter sp.]|nr:fatty acid desaturase [Litoreibacter sp.]
MTNHIAALARIPDDQMADLRRKDTAKGLLHLALYICLIALTGTAIALGVPFWWALLPVHGILLTFLFTLEHECTHQTPFASPTLSDRVGHACGLVLIIPFTWFRYFHLAHHRHTNDPERDPELAHGAKPKTTLGLALHLTGLRYWRAIMSQFVTNMRGQARADYLPASALPRITREARIMGVIYTAAALSLFWTPILLWLWVVPMILGQPFLRLYLLAEHHRLPYVANMLENTRTTYTNRVIRFLAWNRPYHAEHHAAPQVTF